jgi:hypothetical protein
MDELLRIRQEGTLSDEDQADLDRYLEVGRFLDLMRVKALGSLKKAYQDILARVDE